MKIKFGDLTVRQFRSICLKTNHTCDNCPLSKRGQCIPVDFALHHTDYNDEEIELPDEEEDEPDYYMMQEGPDEPDDYMEQCYEYELKCKEENK